MESEIREPEAIIYDLIRLFKRIKQFIKYIHSSHNYNRLSHTHTHNY